MYYADVSFRAGDTLVTAGRNRQSRIIALATCKWSQLLRGQWFSHMAGIAPWNSRAMLFESTTFNTTPCAIQGKLVQGVQAHDPYWWIRNYDGAVWLLRPTRQLEEKQALALSAFCQQAIETPYDYRQAILAGAVPHWIKRWGWIHPDASQLFCDEFWSMALMRAKIIQHGFNPSKATPAWVAWWLVDRWLCHPPILLRTKK